ncbi:MAG: NYN domain-containing protein [Candidatus Heimdallarchaeaceae archaeon]
MEKRIYILVVGFMFFTFLFHPSYQVVEAIDQPIPNLQYPVFNILENATFSMELNSSSLTRGEDDLFISLQYTYENETYIPDSYIGLNVTNPAVEVIYDTTVLLNGTSTGYVNHTIPWSTFNGQDAGNYTVNAYANGTTSKMYIASATFELIVLPFGKLRMDFLLNPVYLEIEQNNYVPFTISNTGGTTAINVTVTNEVEKTGTEGSLTRSISVSNLEIEGGNSFSDNIGFYPDNILYQKHIFTLTYRTIDEPETEKVTESDTLEIIVMPNITIDSWDLPINVTMGEEYLIEYEITNNEGSSQYVLPTVDCENIAFEDMDISTRITPGKNHLTITGNPTNPGAIALFFTIDLEWTTVAETKWYTNLLFTRFQEVQVISTEPDGTPQLTQQIAYGIVFTTLLLGLAYFSRDIFLGLAKRAQISRERIFPELHYPFETAILDGSNIAWEEKNVSNKPKIANVESMINRLSRANFKKIITVADAALRYQIDEQKRLDQLVREGAIKMLPARVDGDKFILRLADEENAMIVSNDMFKEFREDAPWVDERRIPYTILEGEVYLHPTSASPLQDATKSSDENKNRKVNSTQK